MLLVEHGKVCPHCFKRSSKAGGKRKGKGGAAAAVVCPLAPLKRGSSKSSSSSSTTKTLDSGTDSSPASEPQLEPAMPLSSNTAEVQAVTVKVEPVDVPRGGIQQQLHVVTIKQEIKQEPDSQQAVQQQSFIDAVVVPRTQRALKRSRKG